MKDHVSVTISARWQRWGAVAWLWVLTLVGGGAAGANVQWTAAAAATLTIPVVLAVRRLYPDDHYVCRRDVLRVNDATLDLRLLTNVWAVHTGYRGVIVTLEASDGAKADMPLNNELRPVLCYVLARAGAGCEIDPRIEDFADCPPSEHRSRP